MVHNWIPPYFITKQGFIGGGGEASPQNTQLPPQKKKRRKRKKRREKRRETKEIEREREREREKVG